MYSEVGVNMIANDIDIKINGLSKSDSQDVINSIIDLLRKFNFLDLRRLKDIIICDDVNAEIMMMSHDFNKSSINSDEKHSYVFAKVITVVENEDIKIMLILDKNFSLSLVKKNHCTLNYKDSLHVLHHELAHVHDFNKKIDIFKDKILKDKYEGIHLITYPLAEKCWSEYIANFIASSSTTKSSFPKLMAESLALLVVSIPKGIQTNIHVYKSNKKRTDIFDEINLQIESLLQTAAYLLGYMHGLNLSLAEISDEADYAVEKSVFKSTWYAMAYELSSIKEVYPSGWEKLVIYDNLASCFQNFYKAFGIVLKQDEDKNLFLELL